MICGVWKLNSNRSPIETQIRDLEMREQGRRGSMYFHHRERSQLLTTLARAYKEVSADLQETRDYREEEVQPSYVPEVDLDQLT